MSKTLIAFISFVIEITLQATNLILQTFVPSLKTTNFGNFIFELNLQISKISPEFSNLGIEIRDFFFATSTGVGQILVIIFKRSNSMILTSNFSL